MRVVVLGLALLFIFILGTLTINVLVTEGPDILVVTSLIILAMFAFGIVGALYHRPPGS